MNELERFENKQKLTNLQIEKRFVQLEKSFDELFGKQLPLLKGYGWHVKLNESSISLHF